MSTPAATQFTYQELTALVGWYAEMGVDIAIDNQPHDRFTEDSLRLAPPSPAERPAAETPAASDAPTPSRRAPLQRAPISSIPAPVAPEEASAAARDIAASATSLEDLHRAMESFEGCAMKRSAQHTIFASGHPHARLMLVDEAPGADEDREGIPFAGRSGQLLDRMLAAVSMGRTQVCLTNALPWRPPGNRRPTAQEIAICLPFIRRQIELVNPDVLVCFGAFPLQMVLGVNEGILKARGRWFDYPLGPDGRKIKAMATLSPAYLLRSPAQKRLAWHDLQDIAKALHS